MLSIISLDCQCEGNVKASFFRNIPIIVVNLQQIIRNSVNEYFLSTIQGQLSMPTIEYFFTLVSPWTFIGDPILRDIAARSGAKVEHVPVNLGRVFDASGGLPLAKRSDQRKALRMQELKRWRAYRDIEFNLEPAYFPASDKKAAAVVIAAQQAGHDVGELCYAFMRAVWAEEKNIADPDTIIDIKNSCGIDGPTLLDKASEDPINAKWEANTDRAIAAGVMGSPFYIVDGDQCYWGQDRLEFVERQLIPG
jgi:2-hydroxychromene-2-carboxylate isomerase